MKLIKTSFRLSFSCHIEVFIYLIIYLFYKVIQFTRKVTSSTQLIENE